MTCPHARKVSQNMLLEPPKPSPDPPRTLQNRAWSAPRCYKSGQDAPKVPKKGIRSAQERENGAQERKMSQHGPNMPGFWPALGALRTPLRMSKQGIRRHKMQWGLTRLAQQAARRTWRPKTLQNRGRNLKKTMLKNNTFSASILEGFGRRFGSVFGRFFGPKVHAKSNLRKSVRQAKNTGRNEYEIDVGTLATKAFSSKNQ